MPTETPGLTDTSGLPLRKPAAGVGMATVLAVNSRTHGQLRQQPRPRFPRTTTPPLRRLRMLLGSPHVGIMTARRRSETPNVFMTPTTGESGGGQHLDKAATNLFRSP